MRVKHSRMLPSLFGTSTADTERLGTTAMAEPSHDAPTPNGHDAAGVAGGTRRNRGSARATMTERWRNLPPEDKDDDLKTGSVSAWGWGPTRKRGPSRGGNWDPSSGWARQTIRPHPTKRKGAPKAKRVPVKKWGMLKIPSAKDLFG